MCLVRNAIGSLFRLYHTGLGRCIDVYVASGRLGNPQVFFDDVTAPTNPQVNLEGHAIEVDTQYFSGDAQELHLYSSLDGNACAQFPKITGYPDFVAVGTFKNEFWLHDPRFDLHENTVEDPKPDGGGQIVKATENITRQFSKPLCMSAPMTFVNEEGCFLSPELDACGGSVVDNSAEIDLSISNFARVYGASGARTFIYTVVGLRQNSVYTPYPPPCTAATRSRWIKVAPQDCIATTIGSSTTSIFQDLIGSSSDTNPNLRDVQFPVLGPMCDLEDQGSYDFLVSVGSECWRNVHQSHLQVYDFTNWVGLHPGGPARITQFAEISGDFVLSFPASHPMSRWYDNVEINLVELGRLSDSKNLASSPEVAQAFQSIIPDPTIAQSALVCGSPEEVANKKEYHGSSLRGAFDVVSYYRRTTSQIEYRRQRLYVWMEIMLKGQDQLRQKVAWALSQILVISPASITVFFATERFLVSFVN